MYKMEKEEKKIQSFLHHLLYIVREILEVFLNFYLALLCHQL